MRTPEHRLRDWTILFFIFSLGCALRLIPWSQFITPSGIYFFEGDNYEHLRKISLIVQNFPYLPSHDYYIGFPSGTGNLWSPLFDFFIAFFIKVIFLLFPSGANIELITALIPPFIGMLTIIPLFLWCNKVFDKNTALISVLIFIFIPMNIITTLVGKPDNEIMEPFWAAMIFYVYSLCCQEAERMVLSNKKLIGLSVMAGITMAVSLLYWRGAILWWVLLAGHNLCMTASQEWKNLHKTNYFKVVGTVSFLTVSFLIAIVCWTNLWGNQNQMSFNIVSWFHVISALFAVASFIIVSELLSLLKKKNISFLLAISSSIILISIIFFCVIFFIPQYKQGILKGAEVISGANKWTKTISQYQPLFDDGFGHMDLTGELIMFTPFLFTLPLVLLFLITFKKDYKPYSSLLSFFIFSGWGFLFLTLFNKRYGNILILMIAIGGALTIQHIYRFLLKKIKVFRYSLIPLCVVIGFTITMLIPSFLFCKDLINTGPELIKGDMGKTMTWLRDNTPPTSYYNDPLYKPEYGVMARWDYGGWIEYIARRPSVATLFGVETNGILDSAKFFLSTEETEALQLLKKNEARYIILSKMMGAFPGYAELLDIDPSSYVIEEQGKMWMPGPRFFDLVYARLYFTDGQDINTPFVVRGVPNLRLVYESPNKLDIRDFFREVKEYKIFEQVKGAVVQGMGRPGTAISLQGTVRTNQGRRFPVIYNAAADYKGIFSIPVFYSNISSGNSEVGVEGGYILNINGTENRVSITNQDVIEGNVVHSP